MMINFRAIKLLKIIFIGDLQHIHQEHLIINIQMVHKQCKMMNLVHQTAQKVILRNLKNLYLIVGTMKYHQKFAKHKVI
jgi:hypothetical protein